jgi:hypothetical protein
MMHISAFLLFRPLKPAFLRILSTSYKQKQKIAAVCYIFSLSIGSSVNDALLMQTTQQWMVKWFLDNKLENTSMQPHDLI